MSKKNSVAKEAKVETRTVRCPVCSYQKEVDLEAKNIPCPLCRNTMVVRMNFRHIEDYVVGGGVTASGRSTVDNGDEVAEKYRDVADDLNKVLELTAELIDEIEPEFLTPKLRKNLKVFSGSTLDYLKARYVERGLNNGMIRMNCANIVRNAYKRRANG